MATAGKRLSPVSVMPCAAANWYRSREEAVAGFGNAVRGRELVQERAQAQEAGDDDRLEEAAHDEVLLRVPVVLAGQRPLHHVLVQAGHRDDREQAAQELFPEVLRVVHVVEEEHTLVDPDAAEVPADEEDREGDRHDHAGGARDVHADDGFHAVAEGERQADRHVAEHVQPEGEAQRPEHEQLQGQAHEEQADRSAQHLGNEEEPGAGLVGGQPEPVLQVLVDGNDVQLEIQGREHEGDDQVAQEKAEAHLQVAEPARAHHSGDGDERHAGHAGADHREGDDGPVRLASAVVERRIVTLFLLHFRFSLWARPTGRGVSTPTSFTAVAFLLSMRCTGTM